MSRKEKLSPDEVLYDKRNAAACLLLVAMKERFPKVLLAGLEVTPLGFYCDFSFPYDFSSEELKQVEEIMHEWVRQRLPMQIKEMVAFSAKEYFLFHKEPLLAKFVENSSSSSFFLAEIEGRCVLSKSGNALEHLGDIGAFSLQSIEKEKGSLRIYGTAFSDKKELKDFLKTSKDRVYSSHLSIGKKKKLFEEVEGTFVWLPRGLGLLRQFQDLWKREEEKDGFSFVSSIPLIEEDLWDEFFFYHEKIFTQLGEVSSSFKIGEIATFCPSEPHEGFSELFSPPVFQTIRSHVFCQKKDLLVELISSLHFMSKIFRILDFAFHLVLVGSSKGRKKESFEYLLRALSASGYELAKEEKEDGGPPRIEIRVLDTWGRSWVVACVFGPTFLVKNEWCSFARSSCVSFERILALFLEKTGGDFPFQFNPEQVRIIPMQEKHEGCAQEYVDLLIDHGIKAQLKKGKEEFSVLLRNACEEGVIYAIVIGDKEQQSGTISLRNVRTKQMDHLHKQDLVKVLKQIH